jgi:hypothetical protein
MMNHGTEALLKQSPSNAKTTNITGVTAGIKIIQVMENRYCRAGPIKRNGCSQHLLKQRYV